MSNNAFYYFLLLVGVDRVDVARAVQLGLTATNAFAAVKYLVDI